MMSLFLSVDHLHTRTGWRQVRRSIGKPCSTTASSHGRHGSGDRSGEEEVIIIIIITIINGPQLDTRYRRHQDPNHHI